MEREQAEAETKQSKQGSAPKSIELVEFETAAATMGLPARSRIAVFATDTLKESPAGLLVPELHAAVICH